MAVKPVAAKGTAESLLRTYLERFEAQDQKLMRAVRTALRKRLPTANELLYDYKTFFVIAYSATEHPIHGVVSMAARADGVRVYFMNVPASLDPKKLLKGTGKQARYIEVQAAKQLAHPDVEALFAAAIKQASVPMPSSGDSKIVLRAGAAKQASSRKPAK